MDSPARRHRLHHAGLAAAAVAAAIAAPAAGLEVDRALINEYELQLAQLDEQLRQLKQVKALDRKIELKAKFLPAYDAYVSGVLQADKGGQDAVLMTVMVWRIDTGDYTGALHISEYALRHKLALPDQYKRDTPNLIAEEFADAALKARAAGKLFEVSVLFAALQQTSAEDLHDQVRAKLHKAIGYVLRDAADMQPDGPTLEQLTQVREHLAKAFHLFDNVGVKKDIERIDTKIKALTPAAPPAGDGTADTPNTSGAAESGTG